MGYATVMKVPRVYNYAEALKIHDNAKPIRGRSPEIRPLGERRHADTYWIRKHGDAIELVLYKTPVITFEPDGEVELYVNSYNTVSTHQFIHQVLGIPANGVRNATVLVIGGNKYTLAGQDKLRLRMDNGNWQVLNYTPQYGWKLDRKAVKNVRGIYGDFYKYLKGFVSLRTESLLESAWNTRTFDGIQVQQSEFKNVFERMVNLRAYCFMDKRGAQRLDWTQVKPDQYMTSATMFENLIAPDQTEEDRHTNFYKAALLLIAKAEADNMDIRTDSIKVRSKHIVPILDEVLFQFYAHDVLLRYEMPMGKVSTGTYDKWMLEW